MKIDITTTGARTGRRRTIELYAWPDGERPGLVIVGSAGGSARHPAWVHNLRAHPSATVARGGAVTEVVAREVTDDAEYGRLWGVVAAAFPLYESYRAGTKRRIPLFVLEPSARDG